MNPTQGPLFLGRVGSDPKFRKVFLGHYHDVEVVLMRLGSAPIKPPLFFLERIEKAQADLDSEIKLLEVARQEVAAREERTVFLQNVLDQACNGELEGTTHVTLCFLPASQALHQPAASSCSS